MGAYIARRLLLVIPTLLGILIINFAMVQFVPGGPIEQILANLEGQGDVFETIAGGSDDAVDKSESEDYIGARGLPPEFIAELEKEFGFDKPPMQRFLQMMWNYIRFDFGESYFRSISVVDLVLEKMPVSISLGLWSTLIAYLVSIPLGIRADTLRRMSHAHRHRPARSSSEHPAPEAVPPPRRAPCRGRTGRAPWRIPSSYRPRG